jgi:hypothetical protein
MSMGAGRMKLHPYNRHSRLSAGGRAGKWGRGATGERLDGGPGEGAAAC